MVAESASGLVVYVDGNRYWINGEPHSLLYYRLFELLRGLGKCKEFVDADPAEVARWK